MAVLNSLLSPIPVAFVVIIVGYYLGRIKLFGVSFDLSGVLIVAVITGWLLAVIGPKNTVVDMLEYQTYMKMFSNFGTALFVSSIGISTGVMLDFRKYKDFKAALIGSLMVVSAFLTMKLISLVDDKITISKLTGALCGALTTTPGLSAASELDNIVLEDLVLSYGSTYLFGVIATIIFVQILTQGEDTVLKQNDVILDFCKEQVSLGGLIEIGCSVILGRLIGNIEVCCFSLGNSGGMLLSGIIVGLISKMRCNNKLFITKEFSLLKTLGLIMFFTGNGISAGMQMFTGFDLIIIFYGVLMTLVPISSGAVLHKLLFNKDTAGTTIAGGMTSTPAIGVLSKKQAALSLNKYALAYFGALLTIVILIRICAFV